MFRPGVTQSQLVPNDVINVKKLPLALELAIIPGEFSLAPLFELLFDLVDASFFALSWSNRDQLHRAVVPHRVVLFARDVGLDCRIGNRRQ